MHRAQKGARGAKRYKAPGGRRFRSFRSPKSAPGTNRLGSVASRRFGVPDCSQLSPDGGGLSRAAVHRLAADGYDLAADGYDLEVLAISQILGAPMHAMP